MIRIVIFFTLFFSAFCSEARTATEFFTTAPDSVVRLLPQSTRLDMVDYFNYGSKRASQNYFGGDARITSIGDALVSLDVDSDVAMQMAVISAKSDTVLAVVTTLSLPSRDSSVKFYATDWKPLKKAPFSFPDYASWLTADGARNQGDIELFMPFIPVYASFNDDATELILQNKADEYLDKTTYEELAPLMTGEKVYSTSPAKFFLKR